jgi:hypothetical protein
MASSSARPKYKRRNYEKTGDARSVNNLEEYEISSNKIKVDQSIGTGMNPTKKFRFHCLIHFATK